MPKFSKEYVLVSKEEYERLNFKREPSTTNNVRYDTPHSNGLRDRVELRNVLKNPFLSDSEKVTEYAQDLVKRERRASQLTPRFRNVGVNSLYPHDATSDRETSNTRRSPLNIPRQPTTRSRSRSRSRSPSFHSVDYERDDFALATPPQARRSNYERDENALSGKSKRERVRDRLLTDWIDKGLDYDTRDGSARIGPNRFSSTEMSTILADYKKPRRKKLTTHQSTWRRFFKSGKDIGILNPRTTQSGGHFGYRPRNVHCVVSEWQTR